MAEIIKFSRWTKIPDYNSVEDMTTGLLFFDEKKCKQCGICTFICPARSIKRDTGPGAWRAGLPRLVSIAPGVTECIACGCCTVSCSEGAISVIRQFNPGHFYRRLTQTPDLRYPKRYTEADSPVSEEGSSLKGKPAGAQKKLPRALAGKFRRRQMALARAAAKSAVGLAAEQIAHGRFFEDMRAWRQGKHTDISWADLLERRAGQVGEKTFLKYRDEAFTYRQMDENANRAAHFLLQLGGSQGKGLGIFMRNSPRFLDLFFGAQKIGMYLVPINPELKGEGLVYLVNHSDIEILAADAELLSSIQPVAGRFEKISTIVVDDIEKEAEGIAIPEEMKRLAAAYDMPLENPGIGHNPDDICLIIYTSGTTGPPKGVVYRYRTSSVRRLMFLARIFVDKNDTYYTCLPLCHGNALFITTTFTLAAKATLALSRKFSASRFWDEIRHYDVTLFNTIGSIIPILMKQPEKKNDAGHRVRAVFSAACPAEMWEAFENRFGVTLYEGYGAVDGGGKGIMNLGTAPVGSLGKPVGGAKSIRIADENGNPVLPGQVGELMFKMKEGAGSVEYYKNPEASREKSGDGWLRTGDLVRSDEYGFLYFVGRNTESMRKSGENVSAYEVEHAILEHPAVEDAAVYAVPSEMGEDEIMAAVKKVDGRELTGPELRAFLSERLAKYAVPRYIRFVDEFHKTTSHRIIKKVLEEEGVTGDTFDALSK